MNLKNILKLILSILICQSAGIIGSLFTISAIPSWYNGLNKPSFTPPDCIFAPVWGILYTLMGISLYLIINKKFKSNDKTLGLIFFAVQLILNASWSIIFFGAKSILGGFIVILLLWTFIVLTIIKFYKISKPSAIMLYPYLLWVSFAVLLNYSIWKLNL